MIYLSIRYVYVGRDSVSVGREGRQIQYADFSRLLSVVLGKARMVFATGHDSFTFPTLTESAYTLSWRFSSRKLEAVRKKDSLVS